MALSMQDKEARARHWHPVSEAPYGINSSKVGTFLVTSPALQYIFFNGITFGTYRPSMGWFLIADGKLIEHAVTHWRELPPPFDIAPPYEQVKDEVEALKVNLRL